MLRESFPWDSLPEIKRRGQEEESPASERIRLSFRVSELSSPIFETRTLSRPSSPPCPPPVLHHPPTTTLGCLFLLHFFLIFFLFPSFDFSAPPASIRLTLRNASSNPRRFESSEFHEKKAPCERENVEIDWLRRRAERRNIGLAIAELVIYLLLIIIKILDTSIRVL